MALQDMADGSSAQTVTNIISSRRSRNARSAHRPTKVAAVSNAMELEQSKRHKRPRLEHSADATIHVAPNTGIIGKSSSENTQAMNLALHIEESVVKTPKKAKSPNKKSGEKRLKRFRDRAPQSFLDVKDRALTQRMFAINRSRVGSESCPEELVDMVGTTGNCYQVHIKRIPSCNCPHALKGNQCKHLVYVLIRVLKVVGELQYQLAFLPSELRQIFSNAPPIPTASSTGHGHRKLIEDDCPICCMIFEPEREKIVYCKAACGNNVHQECFEQWAVSCRGNGSNITCPFCRAPWQNADETKIRELISSNEANEEGYVNVAGELGLSGRRDFNSYHPYWVRRQQRRGVDVGDWDSPFEF